MGYRKALAPDQEHQRVLGVKGKMDTVTWGKGAVLTVSAGPSLVPPHPRLLSPPTLGAGALPFVTSLVIPHSVLSLLLDWEPQEG